MTYHVNDQTFAHTDFRAAEDAAVVARARLIQRWTLLDGSEQQDDVVAPYPCVDETDTHLWVESPIGLIGIPHVRREHHTRPGGCPVATVSLRISTRSGGADAGAIWAVQCSHVTYDDGTSSAFHGAVISLDELARREVRS